jgi:formate dehydrogenase maturation protein FdhE
VFQRLECPFCGYQEQGIPDYFADDKELYRLYTCQRCLKYLKAIDLRKTEDDILLPLERLLTIDMDRQAHEKGFENS